MNGWDMKRAGDLVLFLLAYPILYLVALLPPSWAVRIGKWMGRMVFYLDGRHRRITLDNLRIAFPDLRASERWRIARRSFENMGKTFLEIPGLGRQRPEAIGRRVRYTGMEREIWTKAQAERRGALLLTGHIGNWELMALAFGLEGGRLAFVARPLDNPYFDRWITRLRSRGGNRIIPKHGALRGVYRALREGYFVGMLMDQRVTGREGVFVDFFGHPAGSSAALALLAGRYGVPVHPVYILREPSDKTHTVCIGQEIPILRTGQRRWDIVENTRRFQKVLEGIVREHPEQWFWMHRRWKGSPTAFSWKGRGRR